MQTSNPAIPAIPATPELLAQLAPGPAQPLLLFPVRLETRFFAMPDGGFELRVRVYPDTLHIDSHEPGLTPEELSWGRHFWEQTWRAAGDDERARAAWSQLADRFDAPRAAWVAHALRPLNPDDRPDDPVPAEASLDTPPRFPDPATRDASWTRPPLARALPARWTVLGYGGGRLVLNVTGSPIAETLAAGPDPQADADPNSEQPSIDGGMRWLVDFDFAERVGMGIRARLTADQAHAGLDFLLVLGIQVPDGETAATRTRLAELLDAHHYTGGLGFVPTGTPSNNTGDAPSGFSSRDPGNAASYHAERAVPASEAGDGSNAALLGAALGLPRQLFAALPHAAAREQLDARHMNTVLWQASWGYYLLQMLGTGATGESPLTDDDIDWARRHFVEYVRPGGPLPTLRIGKQPYGVLPVTSLDAWRPRAAQAGPPDREAALRDLLMRLRELWRRNFADVPRLGRSPDSTTERGFDRDLAEVLSMDGVSSSYAIRGLIGRQYLEHLGVFLSADFFMDAWLAPEPEPPPQEEPPEEEEPPEDLPPRERAAWIRRQRELRLAWIREQEAKQRAYATAHAAWHANIVARGRALDDWWASQQRMAGTLLQTLGITWRPRLANAAYLPPVAALRSAMVQARGETPAAEYIDTLLAARSLAALRHQTGTPRTLLQLLLRHSMLLEYANAASRLLLKRGLLQPAQRREAELVDLPLGQLTRTAWRQLTFKLGIAGEAEPIEVGQYLLGFLPSGEPDTAREPELQPLSEFRAGLRHLRSLTAPRLEQLLAGTLDACSHRLDAWITSLATRRLDELRRARPDDVLYGGYGWVINLRPAATQAEVVPPPGEPGPLYGSDGNPGFIHAPSLAQATTAAVLRSGHLAHAGDETPNPALAIDLSSERVRLATWLLDGVRQGQPLGALLGYRFERRLQEAKKAQFIEYFRELAPLVARKREASPEPVEAIAANNVVDGLALQRRWLSLQDGSSAAGSPIAALFATLADGPSLAEIDAARDVLEAELNALADAVDAVSDALIAESMYQVVRGNPLRAAATVEAIAGGETPPPELDVVRTPRSGTALTQRLITLWSGEPELPAAWSFSAGSARATAEPWLNAWAARLLGDPSRVYCVVERLDPQGQVVESAELSLDRLGLAPLDLIYAVEGGAGGQQAEIEQHILYAAVRMPNGFAPGSTLRIAAGRSAGWGAAELGYAEFGELLRVVRRLITGARALDGDDLELPQSSADFSVDLVELEQRAARAEQQLRAAAETLAAQPAEPDQAGLEQLRESMLLAAGFGVAGAVPLTSGGDSVATHRVLVAQAGSIRNELARRVELLDALAAGAGSGTAEHRRDQALARLRVVFGKAFVVLPRFSLADATELEQALAGGTNLLGGDPLAACTWFQRMARVRDGVARLDDALGYAEALDSGEQLALGIAQLPHDPTALWAALPFEAGRTLPGGVLSLAVQASAPPDFGLPLAGLLIDEWVEVVPGATETTAVAFQYDAPNAVPPQTILLAVPPDIEAPWTIWSLQQVLLETLDLARVRAVDPDALDEVGHYLPALYVAHNTNDDVVSSDFVPLK